MIANIMIIKIANRSRDHYSNVGANESAHLMNVGRRREAEGGVVAGHVGTCCTS